MELERERRWSGSGDGAGAVMERERGLCERSSRSEQFSRPVCERLRCRATCDVRVSEIVCSVWRPVGASGTVGVWRTCDGEGGQGVRVRAVKSGQGVVLFDKRGSVEAGAAM